MVLTLCILAIIVSIAIGWKFKFNTGIIAMGFAFLLDHALEDDTAVYRFVTSWATPESAVEDLLSALAQCL